MRDSNLNNVSLLLPLTNNFKDHSFKLNLVTVVGNTFISATQSKWSESSAYFDGSGDYLTIPHNSDFSFGTENFTIECWVYLIVRPEVNGYATLVSKWNVGSYQWLLGFHNNAGTHKLVLFCGTTGSFIDYIFPLNVWTHFAVSRSGTTTTAYVSGTNVGTFAYFEVPAGSATLTVGIAGDFTSPINAYLQDLRITKGIVRYTTNFTPPAEAFYFNPFHAVYLLLPFTGDNNSTKFNDCSLNNNPISVYGDTKISTTQSKWGTGSAYFDGVGDCLTIPYTNSFDPGTTDWTAEIFMYCTNYNTSSSSVIFGTYTNGSEGAVTNGGWCVLLLQSTGIITAGWGNGSWITILATTTPAPLNVWVHLALVKLGNDWTFYLDGINIGSATYAVPVTYTKTKFRIGSANNGSNYYFYTGYLQDLRITKGVALYTANFTLPTEPFYYPFKKDISFSIVSLLLPLNDTNNSTTFVDYSSYSKTITPFGNTQISTTQSKWGDGSAYFDGTGDYLSITKHSSFIMESSDFTIELWFNTTQNDRSYATLISRCGDGFNAGSWTIMASGATAGVPTIYWADYSGGAPLLVSSTGGYNDGNWHHLAWVRFGNVHFLYLDGISKASITTAAAMADCGTNNLILGTDIVFGNRDYLGYIQDVRITKGVARYSSAFDIPIEPFYHSFTSALILHFDGENNSTGILDTSYNTKSIAPISGAKISTTQSKFGGSSLLLNGSSDYLELIYNTDFDFGTGSFTIECWCYSTTNNMCEIFAKSSGNYYIPREFSFYIKNSTTIGFYYGVRGSSQQTYEFNVTTLPTSNWFHLAFTRNSSSVFKVFVNGIVSTNTYTDAVDLNGALSTYIGAFISNGIYSPYNGYIDELRVIKGRSLYNSNFFPPTSPFENDLQITFNYYLMNKFYQINPGKISGSVLNFKKDAKIFTRDFEDGGNYFIEGNVMVDTIPSSRKVRLCLLNNGKIIKQCWSDSTTGYFRFDDLKFQEYFLWSEDYKKVYSPISKVVGDLLNNNFRNQQLSFASSSPLPSNPSDITKQFIGYESYFGIFNTPAPTLETISYLLESSNIKGTFKIIGQYYINNVLMTGKELILLDKNYYKLEMTISDENGDYIFDNLFYDSYYIASSEDNVQNIILGPILPIPQ